MMFFTVSSQSMNSINGSNSAFVDITISPTTAIIEKQHMLPGDSVSGIINVANTGTVDIFYFISASWSAKSPSTIRQVTRLASFIGVIVEAPDPHILYNGNLVDLIDQPLFGGRLLTLETDNEDLLFTFTLKEDAGASLMGINLTFDLIFVAN